MKYLNANQARLAAILLASASLATAAPTVSVPLLTSGQIDLNTDTITLPLHQGALKDGRSVWYILTDTDNPQKAKELGLVYAPALSNAAQAKSTRTAHTQPNGELVFDAGTVDFSPQARLAPGIAPNYFPPQVAKPGSVGDAEYSPFVRVVDQANTIYNAPILAFDVKAGDISFCNGNVDHDRVHDKVVKLCPSAHTVTVSLTHGFADEKPVVYLSFDANTELAATLEASTYAPAIDDLKDTGAPDTIYGVINGEIGTRNPERQGFDSALSGDGSPLNILDGLPSVDAGYSPLWDLYAGVWTQTAIQNGQRKRLTSSAQVFDAESAGLITNPDGRVLASSGNLVNCPVVAILK